MRFAVERVPVSFDGRGLRYARWAKRFLTFAELPEEPRFRRSYTLYDPDELTALVSPDLAGYVDQVIEQHSDIYNDNSLPDEVNRMCLADARLFLPGLNLAYTDRASMAASVEVRVPFVDPVVRARHSRSRAATRSQAGRARSRSSGPRRAGCRARSCTGRRHPSARPLRAWVRNDLQELINDVLVGGELAGSGMIRADALRRLIDDEQAGREDRAKQIWQLLTLELWYRNMRSIGVAA